MKPRYDVIISGAGPSGSLLGYLLSREGINTLIIEKQEFPRHKICAGGLQHRTLALIPFDVKNILHRSLNGVLFSYRGRDEFMGRYAHPVIHTVDRKEFDTFLAKMAGDNGCMLRFNEKVTHYEQEKNGIIVNTDKKKYRSLVLVGADGVRGTVHRRLTSGKKILRILGYETEKKGTGPEMKKYHDAAGLDFGGTRKGYVWAFPKKDVISFGIGGPFSSAAAMKKYFRLYMDSNGGRKDQAVLAQAIPVRNDDTPLGTYRVIAVGDAACLGDGFTGEGIYNALRSSIMAAESIIKALKISVFDFEDYKCRVTGEIYRDIKISLQFSRVFFSYPLFFYKLLKSNERFFTLCCQVLRGEKKYSDISGKLNIFGK